MNVHTSTNSPENVQADTKYEEKNLSSLGKCVTDEARSEKREKGSLKDKLYYWARNMKKVVVLGPKVVVGTILLPYISLYYRKVGKVLCRPLRRGTLLWEQG